MASAGAGIRRMIFAALADSTWSPLQWVVGGWIEMTTCSPLFWGRCSRSVRARSRTTRRPVSFRGRDQERVRVGGSGVRAGAGRRRGGPRRDRDNHEGEGLLHGRYESRRGDPLVTRGRQGCLMIGAARR